MQLNEIQYSGVIPVDGYGAGFFRIGGQVLDGAVIVAPDGARQWAGFEDAESLTALAGEVDFVLCGTGADIAHVPAAFRAAIEAAGLGIEQMNSPSACRTYNVLASEGRRVALAVLPVG